MLRYPSSVFRAESYSGEDGVVVDCALVEQGRRVGRKKDAVVMVETSSGS